MPDSSFITFVVEPIEGSDIRQLFYMGYDSKVDKFVLRELAHNGTEKPTHITYVSITIEEFNRFAKKIKKEAEKRKN